MCLLKEKLYIYILIAVVQLLSRVQLFAAPWTAACQASVSSTISWSLLKLMSVESIMPSNYLILCCLLLLLPSKSFSASGSFPKSWLFTQELLFLSSLIIVGLWLFSGFVVSTLVMTIIIAKSLHTSLYISGFSIPVTHAKSLQSCLTLRPHGLVARQAALPMGFSRPKYWRGLSFPSPEPVTWLISNKCLLNE